MPPSTSRRSTVLEFDDLLPAQHQELARRGRRLAWQLSGCLVDVGASWVAGLQIVEDEVRVAEDDREDVVEIVRHSPGEAADRLHLLGLPELLLAHAQRLLGEKPRRLGSPSLAEIDDERDDLRVLDRRNADEDRNARAVLVERLGLPGRRHARLPELLGGPRTEVSELRRSPIRQRTSPRFSSSRV